MFSKSLWGLVLAVALVAAGAAALWLYFSLLRPERVELAPGAYAVLAGGGNSVVVEDGGELLVVDTKFPPASGWLRRRLSGGGARVTAVVNTHYHYDHTQGNADYPGARIYAPRLVPELMWKYDRDWWEDRRGGVPQNLIEDVGSVRVGAQEVLLLHPGAAHTRGDLVAYLRRGGRDIVATGDIFPNGYYPFIDLNEGGTDLGGLIAALRRLADEYPEALFVPGHGPVARRQDVVRFADYLQALSDAVAEARRQNLTEDEAAARIDLSQWGLSALPSYHAGRLCWATAETNVRWVYRLQSGTAGARERCTF